MSIHLETRVLVTGGGATGTLEIGELTDRDHLIDVMTRQT